MFENSKFDKYTFEQTPLNRDVFVMDEKYMVEYENMFLRLFSGQSCDNVGEVSGFAIRSINKNSLDASWYPNVFTRFHEVSVTIPRSAFVCCVGCWNCDEKPRIFVTSEWLETLYQRTYSIFGLIDAIGVKVALEKGDIDRNKLITLRDEMDTLSERYPHISFISFADSLLVKSNWSVGLHEMESKDVYCPEQFIFLAQEINGIYNKVLGLNTYTILAQGSNEYYDDALLHVSSKGNHISLNSLGVPFAQLQAIENAARVAIKNKLHAPAGLYLDKLFLNSVKFKHDFNKQELPSNKYMSKILSENSIYHYGSTEHLINNLRK